MVAAKIRKTMAKTKHWTHTTDFKPDVHRQSHTHRRNHPTSHMNTPWPLAKVVEVLACHPTQPAGDARYRLAVFLVWIFFNGIYN